MATLHQYYEMDFSNVIGLHVTFPFEGVNLEGVILYDFMGFFSYFACYVPSEDRKLEYFIKLVKFLKYGNTELQFSGRISLPSAKIFLGELKVEKKRDDININAKLFGDTEWVSISKLQASRRIYIYSETQLTEDQILILKEKGKKIGHDIQFRSIDYLYIRMSREKPLAFISHDSRDKEIARKIAINLQRQLCSVWYDEFSLKVGDNIRESIEKGLKECKKCVLIISHNFISNSGWTKREFESVFTREILEKRNLILPIWYNVKKEDVYNYSPNLLNKKALIWEPSKEEEICRQLYQRLID